MKKQSKSLLLVLLLAFFSASCGSSGNNASGGIGGTGISAGTIEGFGSVIVNGVKFNTDGATFTIDDNQTGTTQGDLAIGMQVQVKVDDSGVTATEVVFESEVEGPVDGPIDTANNSLTVLGRTVVVDDSTVIVDDASPPTALTLAQLSTNDMLEVSGLVLPDDSIQATYIRRRDDIIAGPATELELKGKVSGFAGGITFTIGSQSIDFSRIAPLSFTLTDGQLVEVKGTRNATGAALIATEVKQEDGLGANEGFKLEIEGIVGNFVSSSDFSIGGQAVKTSAATTYEGGVADDIIANVRLEVEGTLTNNGVLVASEVKFRGNRIKMNADVTAKGTSPNSLTLFGKPVVINGLTDMRDGLSFENITTTTNKRLEIRGYLSGGVITATRVKNGDTGDVILQAPVASISGTDFTLLGNNVNTASAVLFKDLDGTSLTSAQFFAKIQAGSLVKVEGTVVGTEITAKVVEIED